MQAFVNKRKILLISYGDQVFLVTHYSILLIKQYAICLTLISRAVSVYATDKFSLIIKTKNKYLYSFNDFYIKINQFKDDSFIIGSFIIN